MSDFMIFALPVGGGTLAISSLPGRGGDYKGDIAMLREWRPGMVITMTTDDEMTEHAVNIGSDIQSIGSRWAHFPVVDYGAPNAQVASQWPQISEAIRATLKGGGRVVVHCRGGCGRSGMVALRLMIEAGEERFDALTRLRALRECAVETRGQLHWAFETSNNQGDLGESVPSI